MVLSAVRVRPAASPATVNRVTPLAVRAATMMRPAVWPSITNIFVPLSVQPSPAAVAWSVMPLSSHLPLGSVKATVAMVSPLAMPGRCAFLAASSPLCSSVLAASTTVLKNGAHSSARPCSSNTMPSSTNV